MKRGARTQPSGPNRVAASDRRPGIVEAAPPPGERRAARAGRLAKNFLEIVLSTSGFAGPEAFPGALGPGDPLTPETRLYRMRSIRDAPPYLVDAARRGGVSEARSVGREAFLPDTVRMPSSPSRRTSPASAARALLLVGASMLGTACASTEPVEPPSEPEPERLVSGAELAERLGLSHALVPGEGRVVLAAPDGDAIVIFPQTTVLSVHGTQVAASRTIDLREGDAWLCADDADVVATLWDSATKLEPRDWPELGPIPSVPRPPSPPERARPALYSDQPSAAEVRAWSVAKRSDRWRYIVIHHSATPSGNASQFDAAHKKRGWDGLGYDFVIGNGTGSRDGAVEVGYRWRQQLRGAHAGDDEMNEHGIGICLVGDFTRTRPTPAQMRALSRLCNFLSSYCGIGRDGYRLHGDVRDTECPGTNFPRDFLAAPRAARSAAAADRRIAR